MKTATPSFTLELPLKTNPVHESTILVNLDAGRQLYNACQGESLKRLELLRQSKEFQEIKTLPKGKNQFDKKTNSEVAEIDRKLAAHRKSLHGHDQNVIISQGVNIKTEKVPYRSQRWHTCCGIEMQRDLYSEAVDAVVRDTFYEDENYGEVI